GASIAAIRYFGDFERFAAISEVTAEKLDAIALRIRLLLDGPADAVDYDAVAELAHAIDEVTVTEIENWQAVFGGKHIAVPAETLTVQPVTLERRRRLGKAATQTRQRSRANE